jgi:hypothetical protein
MNSNFNPKKYFIYWRTLDQYAEGITGQSKCARIYAGPDRNGYTREEAQSLFKQMKAEGKFKNQLIQKDQGYGELGTFHTAKVVSGKILMVILDNKRFKADGYYPKVVG